MILARRSGRVHWHDRRHRLCIGGGFAIPLAPATGSRLPASTTASEFRDDCSAAFLDGACPIVGSYGARDRANRGTADKLNQVLDDSRSR